MNCYCCNNKATEKHHILPKRYGGLNENNLIDLCSKCHDVIDRKGDPDITTLRRIQSYPRLQHLISCRLMCEFYNEKAILLIFRNVINLVVDFLSGGANLDKLKKAFEHLKESLKNG